MSTTFGPRRNHPNPTRKPFGLVREVQSLRRKLQTSARKVARLDTPSLETPTAHLFTLRTTLQASCASL